MEERNFGKKERLRGEAVFAGLLAAGLLIIILNINIGSVAIPVKEILTVLFTGKGDSAAEAIIWKIRMPRIAAAAVLGGGLALAGFLLQTFFSNPIAGPYVLGISHGAKMLVAAGMVFTLERAGAVSSLFLVAAAFVGAMLSTVFILLISRRLRSMPTLLVAGIMIGYICSAATDFIVTFAQDSEIVNLHSWSLGSFSGMSWENVRMASAIILPAAGLVFLLSKPISASQLGENYASSMGVNIRLFRLALILLSSLLSAAVTAFAGPISFVGIAVPQLVKRALNTSKPLTVIPACFLGGAVFCMLCDLIARTAFSPVELNLSTVTSVFGAPVVIAVLLRRQKEREHG
ncbi:MAG: iron ABC transporter permease [Oscillospiraceae bacterium]|nr:iron ABC transporter permease [Oscillospiraceae bacterium]